MVKNIIIMKIYCVDTISVIFLFMIDRNKDDI